MLVPSEASRVARTSATSAPRGAGAAAEEGEGVGTGSLVVVPVR